MTQHIALDIWLADVYHLDFHGKRTAAIANFATALAADEDLKAAAKLRVRELDDLVRERGETACTYSTKHRMYIHEALGA